MSLRKRMFRSHMFIILTSLLSLLIIAGIVIIIFAELYLKDFVSVDHSKVDQNITYASEILNNSKNEWDQIDDKLQIHQYYLFVFNDNEIIYGNDEYSHRFEETVLEHFDINKHNTNDVETFHYLGMTMVGKYDTYNQSYNMAINFGNDSLWGITIKQMIIVFIVTFICVGIIAILLLLLISSFFTKRLSKTIMGPLDILTDGAKRIQSGDLHQKIEYVGDEEFEDVCKIFNHMQETICSNQERIIADEKARNDMITGISHDLRTPLTSIQGYIKGILDGVAQTDDKKKEYLQIAYHSSVEMNTLLQKLFDFSRLETGQMPFHKIKIDILELVNQYISKKEKDLVNKNVHIEVKSESEYIPEIEVDIDQIRRVLDNLLENSIRYADVDPIYITIEVSEENKYIVLKWQDNGKGVSKDKIEHIFERFYRCDEARTIKGSGVGLYVVKSIIKQHSGKILAENVQGLQLTIYLLKGDIR